jgi:hypothetical protein
MMQNSYFWPEFTIWGYQSCEASILVHWTQNDVCECFRWYHEPSARTRFKTTVRAWMHYFGVPKLWSIHSSPLDPKVMFGSVSEHFANLRHVKDAKLVFLAWIHYLGVPKLWSIHSSPLDPKWCLWVFQMISRTLARTRFKTTVRAWMHYFGVPKLWSIHSSPLDPK